MKSYLKVITNILLTSISLSVFLGSLLKIVGPINQSITINRGLNTSGKTRKYIKNKLVNKKSNLSLFYDNKLERFERLDKLINEWKSVIARNPDLDISCFFISLDNQVYAEIKDDEVALIRGIISQARWAIKNKND